MAPAAAAEEEKDAEGGLILGAPAAAEEEKDANGGLILGARGGVRGKTSKAQSILSFDGARGGVRGKNHTQCGLILAPATAEEESQA